eukprot:GHVR01182643.1.p1 GENE.GHVR01182643.1~~GHVR01182643.1.p1  ORF type:complete len:134 (+),score=0.82 GHVR01182643.1:173-574(+)
MSICEYFYGCNKLQERLIFLLSKVEQKLQTLKKLVNSKISDLIATMESKVLGKLVMDMLTWMKAVLGSSTAVFVISASILGIEYAATVGFLTSGMITALRVSSRLCLFLGLGIMAGELCFSLWKASKNSEKLK